MGLVFFEYFVGDFYVWLELGFIEKSGFFIAWGLVRFLFFWLGRI